MTLESVWAQLREVGGELVVVDDDGRGLPEAHDDAGVVWLRRPGAAVRDLRVAGVAAARGAIVAVTEDHCRAAPDWCRRLIEVHTAHPELLMIGGAVDNGARGLVDWASFFIANVESLPPARGPWRGALTGQANISYKRRLLEAHGAEGLDSAVLRATLVAGGRARNDAAIRVDHVQSLGLVGSLVIHFHDGRCMAALRRERMGGARWGLEPISGRTRVSVASSAASGGAGEAVSGVDTASSIASGAAEVSPMAASTSASGSPAAVSAARSPASPPQAPSVSATTAPSLPNMRSIATSKRSAAARQPPHGR